MKTLNALLKVSTFSIVSLFSVQALASATIQYICNATVVDAANSNTWSYTFDVTATHSRDGEFVALNSIPRISVVKQTSASRAGQTTVENLVQDAALSPTGNGASYFGFELASSALGLYVNFYPDSGSILLFHTVAPGKTIVPSASETVCTASEAG